MIHILTRSLFLGALLNCILILSASAQCPVFTASSAVGNESTMCEGDAITISVSGQDIPPGSAIDFYLGTGTFNPYNGEGTFLGSVTESSGNIPDFTYTIPNNFCDLYGEEAWLITGVLTPPPIGGCEEIFTEYFELPVSCPSMSLSGGGDVCDGNCPEAPNEIIFTITGNDVPFVADIMVSVSIFPPLAIDDLEVSDGQQLFICMGGFLPSFDPSTNTLTVPSLAIGLTATVTVVSIISASGCPVELTGNSITLNFIEAASASAGPDQTICSFETVALSGNIGGSASSSEWTTSGDGVFQNPLALNTVYTPGTSDIDAGNVTLTLTATDANGACIPAESSLEVTIESSVYIETGSPLTICNTDVVLIMAELTGPDVPAQWETSGDGVFDDEDSPSTIYTPGFSDLNNGSVTLYFNPVDPDVCVGTNEPLVINFLPAPEVEVPDELEVCAGDSILFDIVVSGDFTDITWSTMGDGTLEIINDTEVTYYPGDVDIDEGFTIVSVTVVSVYPECGQTTYNIPLYVVLCDCPDFETHAPAGPVCSFSGLLDLSSLLDSGGAGEWAISSTPGGSNPAIVVGDDFITDESDPGVYTVTYTLDNPEPGCPLSSSEIVEVASKYFPEAGAGIANCGPDMVFVSGMTIPFGAPEILWESLGDGYFVNPSGLATSYIPGANDSLSNSITLILHVLDTLCGNETDTTYILFPNPPFTSFFSDTVIVCNEEDKGSIVDFPSLITGGDSNGIWMNTGGAPVDFSIPDSVNFDGVAEGFYAFSYQTNSAEFPCQEITYTIIVNVQDCQCPFIDAQPVPTGICNSGADLSLGAFISAGAPGTWSVFNAPMGINPATINGAILEIGGADQGTYGLRFTFNAAPIDGCPDSAEIVVFIQDQPFIEVEEIDTTCNSEYNPIDVILGGSAINSSWTTSGTGIFTINTILQPVYNMSADDAVEGEVFLYGMSVDTFGFCPPDIDTIHMIIYSEPVFGFVESFIEVCNTDPDSSVVNFWANITGDLTGIFSDESNAMVDLGDPNAVDFFGVPPGDYQFYYTVYSPFPHCLGGYSGFVVRVVENCNCDSFIPGNIPDVVCTSDIILLDSILIDPPLGVWSVANGQQGDIWPEIIGNQVITTGADAGTYILVYTLTNPKPGCPDQFSTPFRIEVRPGLSIINTLCDQQNSTYSVTFATNATTIVSSFGDVEAVSIIASRIDSIPIGQNVILELASASMQCNTIDTLISPDCECTLFIENISDPIFLCPGDTFVLIPFLTGAQGFAFSTWIGETTVMQPTYPVFEEGNYVWIVVDSAGCEERDSFSVELIDSLVVEYNTVSPSCDGLSDGMIIITSIQGGELPYSVQIDNGQPFSSNAWPDTIKNLGVGKHNLLVTDMSGCERNYVIDLEEAFIGNVSLGADLSIQLGDSVLIAPIISDIAVEEVIWDPPISTDTDPFWFTPLQTTLVNIFIKDLLGCMYSDQKLITVIVEQNFYVPTAFTPNGDQINDRFEIATSLNSVEIKSLEIYDRWGNMIYRQLDQPPFSWDGIIKSRNAAAGVYVVKLIYLDSDGNEKIYTSDLTLIR